MAGRSKRIAAALANCARYEDDYNALMDALTHGVAPKLVLQMLANRGWKIDAGRCRAVDGVSGRTLRFDSSVDPMSALRQAAEITGAPLADIIDECLEDDALPW